MRCIPVLLVLVAVSLLVTACASDAPEPTRSGSRLLDPTGDFVLYVSNQSFEIDRVDIMIEVDGEPVVDADFEVGNQHNWKRYVLRLSPGRHSLKARSMEGDAILERSFLVTKRHWAVLNYWYYSEAYGSPPAPKHFEFEIFDRPIQFA